MAFSPWRWIACLSAFRRKKRPKRTVRAPPIVAPAQRKKYPLNIIDVKKGVGVEDDDDVVKREVERRSRPLVYSFLILTSPTGDAVLPFGITRRSKERESVESAVGGIVSVWTFFRGYKKRHEVEQCEYVARTEFAEDLIHAGDMELSKDIELVHFVVVDREAGATEHTRDDHILARSWRCVVLGGACCRDCVRNIAFTCGCLYDE